MGTSEMREAILAAAEERVRRGGYNGFSFRDLANDVGVKSSSIHYHFPTKAVLTEHLVLRYTEKTKSFLEEPGALEGIEAILRVVALFRAALEVDDQMCLCGILGAEHAALPPEVVSTIAKFFELLTTFLDSAFGPEWMGPSPPSIVARLEGALIVSRVMGNTALFEAVVSELVGRRAEG